MVMVTLTAAVISGRAAELTKLLKWLFVRVGGWFLDS